MHIRYHWSRWIICFQLISSDCTIRCVRWSQIFLWHILILIRPSCFIACRATGNCVLLIYATRGSDIIWLWVSLRQLGEAQIILRWRGSNEWILWRFNVLNHSRVFHCFSQLFNLSLYISFTLILRGVVNWGFFSMMCRLRRVFIQSSIINYCIRKIVSTFLNLFWLIFLMYRRVIYLVGLKSSSSTFKCRFMIYYKLSLFLMSFFWTLRHKRLSRLIFYNYVFVIKVLQSLSQLLRWFFNLISNNFLIIMVWIQFQFQNRNFFFCCSYKIRIA
jgi:hypothetical protein